MRKIDVLIVDDEIDCDLLGHFLRQYCPAVNHIDVAVKYDEAIDLMDNNSYDLFFLDIILDEKTAFELLKEVQDHPFIIFVTAFDQFAIESFKFNTIDYILKPIQIQSLIEAVERVLVKIEKKEFIDHGEIHKLEKSHGQSNQSNQSNFITISSVDKVCLIKRFDILYFKSSGRYTEFHLNNKTTPLVASKSLGEYECQLAFKEFFRIHNSYMVNLNHLVDITKKSGNYCRLIDGTELPISRRRYDKLLHYLKIH